VLLLILVTFLYFYLEFISVKIFIVFS